MKNKTIKLMLAVGVLVVGCGVYMGVKNYVSSQEEQEAQNSEKKFLKKQCLKRWPAI